LIPCVACLPSSRSLHILLLPRRPRRLSCWRKSSSEILYEDRYLLPVVVVVFVVVVVSPSLEYQAFEIDHPELISSRNIHMNIINSNWPVSENTENGLWSKISSSPRRLVESFEPTLPLQKRSQASNRHLRCVAAWSETTREENNQAETNAETRPPRPSPLVVDEEGCVISCGLCAGPLLAFLNL